MANFDNGLPPVSTDMTGKSITGVSMEVDNANTTSQQGIQAIYLNTEATENQTESGIKSITFSTEPTGKNQVFFYL